MAIDPSAPRRASETVRESLRRVLREADGPLSALEISGLVGIAQREVGDHLEHLQRTQANRDERLEVQPARCLKCQFEFETRERLARPSRCPKCKSERIDPPRFRLV